MPGKNGPERRVYEVQELRVESADGDPRQHIRGYAAVFDQPSVVMGFPGMRFVETVRRGAFAKTIQEADIRALWNHNADYVLGRNRAGTLTLTEDIHGLRVDIIPPDTQWGRDAVESIRRGDVSQMSFAFDAIKDEWQQGVDTATGEQLAMRALVECRLFDVSPVTYPAYPQTEVSLRAAQGWLNLYGAEPPAGQEAREHSDGHNEGEPEPGQEAGDGAAKRAAQYELLRRKLDLAERE